MVILHDEDGMIYLISHNSSPNIAELEDIVRDIYGDVSILIHHYDKTQEELDDIGKRIVSMSIKNDGTFEVELGKTSGVKGVENAPTLESTIKENQLLRIALAESIEKQETDKVQNQIALAELLETLILKGVL